jgi:hypothetical protein
LFYSIVNIPRVVLRRTVIPNTSSVLDPQIPDPLAALEEDDPPLIPPPDDDDPDAVAITPPEPVGVLPPILLAATCPTVKVVGLATGLADGTFDLPDGIACTLLADTLNFVCAIEISALACHVRLLPKRAGSTRS